jgi:hypothetical protein
MQMPTLAEVALRRAIADGETSTVELKKTDFRERRCRHDHRRASDAVGGLPINTQ